MSFSPFSEGGRGASSFCFCSSSMNRADLKIIYGYSLLSVLAVLHPALLALLRGPVFERSVPLALAKLFSLIRRHVLPAFFQPSFFLRRQIVEPFTGAA